MSVDKILEELYMLDPELKNQEKELRKFIELMIKNRPEIVIDENFIKELKSKLLSSKNTVPRRISFPSILYFSLPVGAALVILLALVSLKYYQAPRLALITKTQTNQVGDEGFGSLALINNRETKEGGVTAPQSSTAIGGGGPGVGFGGGAGILPADQKLMVPPQNQGIITYEYAGDPLTPMPDDSPVLRRIKSSAPDINQDILSLASLDTVSTDFFRNSQLTHLQLKTKGSNSFLIDVDYTEGNISFNEDYNSWNHPEASCASQECYDQFKINASDIPDDAQVISVAKDFLQKLNLNPDTLGEPQVNQDWRQLAAENKTAAGLYYPESLSVVFPYQFNGGDLVDETGNPYGIQLTYNIRLKTITSVFNIIPQKYEKSNYTMEHDMNRILAVAKKGGVFPQYFIYSADAKNTTVKLKTPKTGYIKMWFYGTPMSQDLLVPAYFFETETDPAATSFIKRQIIVPAVKEVLDQLEKNLSDIPQPVPMIK